MATDGRLHFELNFGRERAPARRRGEDEPFCVLVCADLSGAAHGASRTAFGARRPIRVDADTLDRQFARLAPAVDARVGGDTVRIAFESPDDFHPDHLVRRAGAFARLRGLRQELGTAGGFERAAAALGFAGAAPAASPKDTAADIERLLGRPPQQAPAAPATPLDAWLHDLVAPHIVADTSGPQRMLTAAIDASLADLMRALLRDPALRRLEAAWRGVERLVSELGGEPSIEIWLLDASRQELDDEVRAFSGDLSASALWRILGGEDADGVPARPWSVVAVDAAFGPGPGDVALLAALGSMAGRIGAALLADADPSVLGCARAADLRSPAAWGPLEAGAGERWRALRTVDAAAWIGLALPRVLMRRPYGAKSDPIEAFAFEEVTDPGDPDAYLWGSGALLLAMLAGRAFRDAGARMDLDDSLEADDMPVHSWRADGEPKLRACAETLLPDSAAERVLSAGLMPLVASAGAGTVRLLRWQSIADPLQRLRGPWA